jgi:hypothetical protein
VCRVVRRVREDAGLGNGSFLFGAMKDIAGFLYQSYQSGQRAGVTIAPTRKQQTGFLRHRHGRRKRLVEHLGAIPRAGSLGMIVASTNISGQELNDSDTYDRKAA